MAGMKEFQMAKPNISLDFCMCLSRLTLLWSIGSFPHSWMLWFPDCGFLFVSNWYLGILGWCYDFMFAYVSVLRAGAVCQWSVPTLGTWRSFQRHPALRALVTPQMAPRLCSSTSHLSVYLGTPEVTIGWYNNRHTDDGNIPYSVWWFISFKHFSGLNWYRYNLQHVHDTNSFNRYLCVHGRERDRSHCWIREFCFQQISQGKQSEGKLVISCLMSTCGSPDATTIFRPMTQTFFTDPQQSDQKHTRKPVVQNIALT